MAKLQIIGVIGFLEFWRENNYVLKVFGLGPGSWGLGVRDRVRDRVRVGLGVEFWRESYRHPTAILSLTPHP